MANLTTEDKVISLQRLSEYDGLIKDFIEAAIKTGTAPLKGALRFMGSKNSTAELYTTTGCAAGDVYQVGDREYVYIDNDSQVPEEHWELLGVNLDISKISAANIVESTTRVFVTPQEKAKWNAIPTPYTDKAKDSGFYKFSTDKNGRVVSVSPVTTQDIVSLMPVASAGEISGLFAN